MAPLAPSKLPVIRACLFDVDGLLIDSEDIYTECTNAVLHKYGKPSLPWSIKARLQGRPNPEAGRILQEWAQLPIQSDEFKRQTLAMQEKMFERTKALPGVPDLLKRLSGSNVQLAVATSSMRRTFDIKTKHLSEMFSVFDVDKVVVGDDPRIAVGRGKPLPDIYLLALSTINATLPADQQIHPEECLVFEDSVPGVEAGRRAGMQVAWVPHPGLLEVYTDRKREVLAGRTGEHVDTHTAEEIEELEKRRDGHVSSGRQFARVEGQTGEVDDGWARLYASLEGFPFELYGIEER